MQSVHVILEMSPSSNLGSGSLDHTTLFVLPAPPRLKNLRHWRRFKPI